MVKATARIQRRRVINRIGQRRSRRQEHHGRCEIVPEIHEQNQIHREENIRRQRNIDSKHNTQLRRTIDLRRLAKTAGQASKIGEENQEIHIRKGRFSNPFPNERIVQP